METIPQMLSIVNFSTNSHRFSSRFSRIFILFPIALLDARHPFEFFHKFFNWIIEFTGNFSGFIGSLHTNWNFDIFELILLKIRNFCKYIQLFEIFLRKNGFISILIYQKIVCLFWAEAAVPHCVCERIDILSFDWSRQIWPENDICLKNWFIFYNLNHLKLLNFVTIRGGSPHDPSP